VLQSKLAIACRPALSATSISAAGPNYQSRVHSGVRVTALWIIGFRSYTAFFELIAVDVIESNTNHNTTVNSDAMPLIRCSCMHVVCSVCTFCWSVNPKFTD